MSAFGTKRTSRRAQSMSAFGGKADIHCRHSGPFWCATLSRYQCQFRPQRKAARSKIMPRSNQPGGPWGSGQPRPPDLEEFLRRSQDRLRGLMPGNLGNRGFALIALAAVVLWAFSGFFRVEPDEVGVVLRFGKFVREVQPGLNYHLPYPIETALTPQALRVNKIDIGFNASRGSTMRDVPEEALMLTGDENIVDVDFSVLWKVKPNRVGDFLFNVLQPEGTVKAVGESAMRTVIGRSNIQAILTGARQTIETAVQELMQKVGALLHHHAAARGAAGRVLPHAPHGAEPPRQHDRVARRAL